MINTEMTTGAVRLALGMQHLRAECASRNIANANLPGAQAIRPDFAQAQGLLEDIARAGSDAHSQMADRLSEMNLDRRVTVEGSVSRPVQVDEEVADMVGASLAYQTLTQSLSRYFGLMRLAVTGRS